MQFISHLRRDAEPQRKTTDRLVKEHAPAVFAGLEASVPFPKRLGKPEEFGSLVMELTRNTYFNGQLIRLDGAIRMPPR